MIGTLMSLRRLKISVPSWQVRCAIPNLESGAVSVVYRECGGRSLTGPNHIVFDQDGGFWFTDHGKLRPRDRDRGGIYYATIDGKSIREIVFPLDAPNGIALSPDGTRLYVAESFTARVWAWDVMGPGELRTKPRAGGRRGFDGWAWRVSFGGVGPTAGERCGQLYYGIKPSGGWRHVGDAAAEWHR
jgi:sugar lactone lactonase YvrE